MQDKVKIGEHRTRLAFARRAKPVDMATAPLSGEQIEHLRPLWKAWDTPGMDDETWDALCNMALAPLSEKQAMILAPTATGTGKVFDTPAETSPSGTAKVPPFVPIDFKAWLCSELPPEDIGAIFARVWDLYDAPSQSGNEESK